MQYENVTCPHCGLLCDDLSVKVSDLSLRLLNADYAHCAKAYADASFADETLPTPLIDGTPATFEQAIEKAIEILKSCSQPLVNGLIADIQACREAVALTEKISGVIDHANGTSIRNGTAVMQRIGEVRATLAEVRNRADCIVILGSEILQRFPRLQERVLNPNKTLDEKTARNKKIFILDLSTDGTTSSSNEGNNVTRLLLNFPLMESLVYRLQEVITKPKESIINIDENTEAFLELKEIILASNYTTFIWSLAEFNSVSAEHTVQALTETIKVLMNKIRCVGLPLGGSKGEITANQVATWQTGVSLPVAFMQGTPMHDPTRYDGLTMLKNKEVDCLVWIATYSSEDSPPETDAPTIVLGHPKMACKNAAVFIPVGIPGIDHRGLACRTDNVATLPLHAIRNCELPAASDVLHKIIQSL